MLDFHQKRKIRGIMYHKVTLTFFFILVLIAAHSTWDAYLKKSESEKLKNMSFENVQKLKIRDGQLKENIEKLSTEYGIEEEIRSKFSVAKDNEAMVVVVEKTDFSASTTENSSTFWQKIANFFKNL
jgi:hypothetical protein